MGWLFWVLVTWLTLIAIATIVRIGEVRTKVDAALGVAEVAAVIAILAIWWPR